MIERSEAVVLKGLDYGETSQIVQLYSRRRGRMSVMARGSRRPGSRFGATLQPMAVIEAVYYHRPGRDLQTLKEASHVVRLKRAQENVDRLAAAFRVLELVRGLTEPGDPNPVLFNRVLQTLIHLDTAGEHALNALPHFQLVLARELGFEPNIQRDDVLALPADGGTLNLARGTVAPVGAETGAAVRASRSALRAFAIFARTDLETALRMRLEADEFDETMRLVDAFLRHHVEQHYPDRAAGVMRQLRISTGSSPRP